VGYGATALRSELTERLLESGARGDSQGNGSENLALAGAGGAIRGVDDPSKLG
jgi:hydroxyethylthiazole kinase-like sugar kinase family protein